MHSVGAGVRFARGWLSLAVCLLAMASESHAADKFWDGGAAPAGLDGMFSDSANWDSLLPPRLNDIAYFGTSVGNVFQNAYTVSFTTDPTNQALVVEDDNVTFDLNGHLYTTTADNAITLGVAAPFTFLTGHLTITDGIVAAPFESNVLVGASRAGFLTVASGGLLIGTANVYVGYSSNGTLTVSNNGDVIANDVIMSRVVGATSLATITGSGSSLLAADLIVGEFGTGTLNVTGGGDVDSTSGTLGLHHNASGIATVDGAGSTFDISGPLTVGRFGEGTLDITGGGLVESTSGHIAADTDIAGTVNVSGTNSRWINTGRLDVGKGHAKLNITAGGRVENTEGLIITGDDLFPSAVKVAGANSQWINSGLLTVAGFGKATLDVTSSGRVSSNGGIIGHDVNGNGTVTVEGDESLWDSAGALIVGDRGIGTLDVIDGGQVNSDGGTLGLVGNSLGRVSVRGRNSIWFSLGFLVVGSDGHGQLDITGGGRVISHTGLIASATPSTGTVTVAGADSTGVRSTLFLGGRLEIGVGRSAQGGRGRLHIQPGGFVTVAEDIVLGDDGEMFLEGGTLSTSEIDFQDGGSPGPNFVWTSGTLHVGTYNGDLTVPNGGVLAPGHSAGRTHVLGDYAALPGATLGIEIGGRSQATQYDLLYVDGNISLDGNLQLTMLNGFMPSASDTFFIGFSNVGISGAFDNVASGQRLTTSDGLGSFLVQYGPANTINPSAIVLSDFLPGAVLRGDFNGDGVVDALDIDLLASAAHNDADNLLYDLDDDGTVTFAVGQPNAPDPSDSDVLIHEILETRYGDADLNGQVFLSDLTRLATSYRQPGQFGWAEGNFNGSQEAGTTASPRVFLSDLTVLATNWRFGVGGSGASIGAAVPRRAACCWPSAGS
jgi:T5SS/PEP-CTERM-associated repeat protein